MAPPHTLDRHTLPLNTDVAEWCPHPAAQRLLAVGTYQLNETSQQRLGGLHLYFLEHGGPDSGDAAEHGAAEPAAEGAGEEAAAAGENRLPAAEGSTALPARAGARLAPLASLQLPGIFDLRWHPSSAMPTLAAALADGSVRVLTLPAELAALEQAAAAAAALAAAAPSAAAAADDESPPAIVVLPGSAEVEGMAVSLDYSRCAGCAGEQLVVSYSSGQLQLFQAAPSGLTSLAAWQAHDLEAWVAATDHWHPSLIHSGGDDAAFRLWDSRQGFAAPVWQNRKAHGAGVCCAASSPHQEHVACTGSYDDRLRMWDLRMAARPVQLGEVDAGGGVWRARWHPTDPHLLLAACMYNGFAVLRLDGATQSIQVVSTYEHAPGSLSYGADWCWEPAGHGGTAATLAATASFYDRQLHLWDTGV